MIDPSGSLCTPAEYVLDLDTAHAYITSLNAETASLRRACANFGDAIDRLHLIVRGLKADKRQLEIDNARLQKRNAEIDFAFQTAAIVVADLERQLHGYEVAS